MSNLSIYFFALYCVLYIQSQFACVDSRPPDNLPTRTTNDDATEATRTGTRCQENPLKQVVPNFRKKFNRLPGVCRRLKRRRITILCNTAKFCSARRFSKHGHICPCPKGSKCSHFFLWSL